jgi:hypothetical protein
MLDIQGNPSTAYYPQTDGQTKRINQEVEIYLQFYINYQQLDWQQWLPFAEFTYNDHQHSSTGKTPFTLTNGGHLYKGFELHKGNSPVQTTKTIVLEGQNLQEARETLKKTQAAMTRAYDQH